MDVVASQERLIPSGSRATVEVVFDKTWWVADAPVELTAVVWIGIESFALASTATTWLLRSRSTSAWTRG